MTLEQLKEKAEQYTKYDSAEYSSGFISGVDFAHHSLAQENARLREALEILKSINENCDGYFISAIELGFGIDGEEIGKRIKNILKK